MMRIDLEHLSHCSTWQCWTYTATSRRLVLFGQGQAGPTGRPVYACLVLRQPERIRVPWHIQQARVTIDRGGAASNELRESRSWRPGPLERLCLRCDPHQYEINCRKIACYSVTERLAVPLAAVEAGGDRRPDRRGLSPRTSGRSPSYSSPQESRSPGSIAPASLLQSGASLPCRRIYEAQGSFDALAGATLAWWWIAPNHGSFFLLASREGRGSAEVRLIGTRYLEVPHTMHSVAFRLASDRETERLRDLLPSREAEGLRRQQHLILECEEGVGQLWCSHLMVRALPAPDWQFLRSAERPLWPGGPSLDEL